MLNLYTIMIVNEHNTNQGLRVMQNPGFIYLHSDKRSGTSASLRLPV